MHLLPADQVTSVLAHLQAEGYAVARATTPAEGSLRPAQAELARALRLPDTAATNLDAMADTLRDLPQIWGSEKVVLLWEDAERLAGEDGRAWWILGELLDEADALTVVAFGEARLGRPSGDERGGTADAGQQSDEQGPRRQSDAAGAGQGGGQQSDEQGPRRQSDAAGAGQGDEQRGDEQGGAR